MRWRPVRSYISDYLKPKARSVPEIFTAWAGARGVTHWMPAGSMLDTPGILKGGRRLALAGNVPPRLDHGAYFKNQRTGAVWLVYHPYCKPGDILEAAEAYARENELVSFVWGEHLSWYYPGGTCMVVMTAKQQYEKGGGCV